MKAHKFIANNPDNFYSLIIYCEYCGHVVFTGNSEGDQVKIDNSLKGCPLAPDIDGNETFMPYDEKSALILENNQFREQFKILENQLEIKTDKLNNLHNDFIKLLQKYDDLINKLGLARNVINEVKRIYNGDIIASEEKVKKAIENFDQYEH